MHMPVLIIIACLVLMTGCAQTETVSVAPINVSPINMSVDVNLHHKDGHDSEGSPDIISQAGKIVLDKTIGPGSAAGDLCRACLAFRKLNQKWPANISDTMDALKAEGGYTEGLSQLEWAEFKILDDGSLEVNYKSKGQVEGEGCIQLYSPKKDDKPQPQAGGDKISPPQP